YRTARKTVADRRHWGGPLSYHHEESRSTALVRPGQRPAPFLLGLRGRARLSLVPEAGARQRHGVLGARTRGHAARLGRARAGGGYDSRSREAQRPCEPTGTTLH